MTNEKSLLRAGVLSFVLVLVLQALPLAAASPGDLPGVSRHCVAALERVKPGAADSEVVSFECYLSFSEAIYHATNGAVSLPEGLGRQEQLDLLDAELKALPQGATEGTFIVAIDYEDSDYDDSTLSWTAPDACTDFLGHAASSMPSGWNDQVGSTRGFSNCNRNVLFEHINFGGATRTCFPDCSNVGAMDDETSSRQWYRVP